MMATVRRSVTLMFLLFLALDPHAEAASILRMLGFDQDVEPTITASPSPVESSDDATTRQLREDQVRKHRLDIVKREILEKLRLSQPPNVSISATHLPIAQLLQNDEYDVSRKVEDTKGSFYGETKEIVIFGEKENCEVPQGCFKFKFQDHVQPEEIMSAELWVHLEGGQTSYVDLNTAMFDLSTVHHRHGKRIVAPVAKSLTQHWLKYDVKATVRRWRRHPDVVHGIELSDLRTLDNDQLKTEDDVPITEQRPFLVVHTRPTAHKRIARSTIECGANTYRCCRDTLYIDFEELGYSSWIVHPKGYNAFYCRGICHDASTLSHSPLLTSSTNVPGGISSCCVPTRTSPLEILYVDSFGQVIKSSLPGMVVEACGCS